ncbi:MAG: CRISPR system precrRNA processing endoribonuclease RAMP protein Cas6, partial [Dialister sp.]|nr:CRISPR system precrRNA processing endoribonuclease RAMP protein Cas6 [Dialister sp.]MDY5544600.1 CRISPR system precrRNA processing endoribonuclease RAMP protein Cas6 [Dialister sp.]
SDYHLHMHPFSVEGRRIRAFRGNVTYGFFKNDMAASLAATLASFAMYTGIGIKTALGMGAAETEVAYWEKKQ